MENLISISKGGTCISGPDGMKYVRAATIWSALPLYKVGMQVTRGVTGRKILDMATEFTGKTYKRGDYDTARADMRVWLDAARASLPIERDGVPVAS